MPKIRDLGISVIPATMRPAEIGGGAGDFEYWAQKTGCPATDIDPAPCGPTPKPQCNPSPPPPQCQGTPKKIADPVAFSDGAVMQLKQQLHDQINTELLN